MYGATSAGVSLADNCRRNPTPWYYPGRSRCHSAPGFYPGFKGCAGGLAAFLGSLVWRGGDWTETPSLFALKTASTRSSDFRGFFFFPDSWSGPGCCKFDSLFVLSGSICAAILADRREAQTNKGYHKPAPPNITNDPVQGGTCGNDTLLFYGCYLSDCSLGRRFLQAMPGDHGGSSVQHF